MLYTDEKYMARKLSSKEFELLAVSKKGPNRRESYESMSATPSPHNGRKTSKIPRVATLAKGPKNVAKEQESSLANGAPAQCFQEYVC